MKTEIIDRYRYSVAWSKEDRTYVARAEEFEFLAAHGPTAQAALEEIIKVVSLCLADRVLDGGFVIIPIPLVDRRKTRKQGTK